MEIGNHTTHFFRYWNSLDAKYTEEGLKVGEHWVTYKWEKPLMQELARAVTESHGNVLEVGFGLGLSAEYIQEFGVKSHTILEPHPKIFEAALEWKKRFKAEIHLINDFWQNQINSLGRYDAILYDSYSPDECIEQDSFRFLRLAAQQLLSKEGRLSFWYPKDALPEHYQRELLKHFKCLTLFPVHELTPSKECKQLGFGSTMIVPVADR